MLGSRFFSDFLPDWLCARSVTRGGRVKDVVRRGGYNRGSSQASPYTFIGDDLSDVALVFIWVQRQYEACNEMRVTVSFNID